MLLAEESLSAGGQTQGTVHFRYLFDMKNLLKCSSAKMCKVFENKQLAFSNWQLAKMGWRLALGKSYNPLLTLSALGDLG